MRLWIRSNVLLAYSYQLSQYDSGIRARWQLEANLHCGTALLFSRRFRITRQAAVTIAVVRVLVRRLENPAFGLIEARVEEERLVRLRVLNDRVRQRAWLNHELAIAAYEAHLGESLEKLE